MEYHAIYGISNHEIRNTYIPPTFSFLLLGAFCILMNTPNIPFYLRVFIRKYTSISSSLFIGLPTGSSPLTVYKVSIVISSIVTWTVVFLYNLRYDCSTLLPFFKI